MIRSVVPIVFSVIGLFWIIGHYRFFLEMNWPLLRGDGNLGFYSGFFGPWSFSLTNSQPLHIFQSMTVIAMTTLLGWKIVGACGVVARTPSGIFLSWFAGFCASGIVFHLLASLHLQHTLIVWLVWGILLTFAFFLKPRTESHSNNAANDAPNNQLEFLATCLIYLLIGIIFFAIFWNAIFFEETYWDGLILYLGYSRMTFLEGGFPFKAEAQVGVGLGANYPHLYPNYGSLVSTMFGEWSTFHQRLAAPLAGIGTAILIHSSLRQLVASRLIAAAATLAMVATPHFIAFSTYASDYAFSLFFSAVYAWIVIRAKSQPTAGDAILLALFAAAGMHLNYLMGIFWGASFLYFMLVLILNKEKRNPRFGKTIAIVALLGMTASTPWYARNYILTNNPVYSFFPEIFTESIRVNVEVLRSAELEWFRNGDGIGRPAELFIDFREGLDRDVSSPDFVRETRLADRIRASWYFWSGFDYIGLDETGRDMGPSWPRRLAYLAAVDLSTPREELVESGGWQLLRNPQSFKLSLFFMAFFLPGLVTSIWYLRKNKQYIPAIAGIASLISVYFIYHYIITDFYLYQIIGFLPLAAIFGGFFLCFLSSRGEGFKWLMLTAVICIGIFPGIPFAFMNFKAPAGNSVGLQRYRPELLDVFRNPGISPALMWRIQYGADPEMWDVVNDRLIGERLLTHENRHLVFDPSITLVHLDDWDIQKGYDMATPEETVEFLRGRGLRYYLRTRNEFAHEVNRRLGMQAVIEAGFAREIFRAGDNALYDLGESPL